MSWPLVQVQTVLTMPAGEYQLHASAMSRALAKSGSVYLQIDVPAMANVPLALSGLAVGTGGLVHVAHDAPLKDLVLPFVPSLDRVFVVGDRLRLFFPARTENKAPGSGTIALVDDSGRELAALPWNTASGGVSPVDVQLSLDGVAPGPYRLVVRASEGPHAAIREVGIRVEARTRDPGPRTEYR